MKFSTWLYAIATNLVKDRYRHRTRHPQVSLDAEVETTVRKLPRQLAGPKQLRRFFTSNGTRGSGSEAVAQLPEETRVAGHPLEYEDLSHAGARRDFEMLGQGCRDAPLPCADINWHPAWLADGGHYLKIRTR